MIDSLVAFTNELSRYIIPVLLVGIPFYGLAVKKVKVYESFVEGAKDGFAIAAVSYTHLTLATKRIV